MFETLWFFVFCDNENESSSHASRGDFLDGYCSGSLP